MRLLVKIVEVRHVPVEVPDELVTLPEATIAKIRLNIKQHSERYPVVSRAICEVTTTDGDDVHDTISAVLVG
jgi:hypothetical protein